MRSIGAPLVEKVRDSLQRCTASETTLLVAFSGGSDSTALLAALATIKKELSLTLCAAYFDHGIQATSVRRLERETATATADDLGVALVLGHEEAGSISEMARETGDGLEATARRRRYDFLTRSARAVGASVICTAHHRDDLVETVILRVVQGAGFHGLAGIPMVRAIEPGIRVVRPLLGVSKQEILTFLKDCDLRWHPDPSNVTVSFARNRVRHEILPAVTAAFPDAPISISRFAGRNAEAARYIAQQAAATIVWTTEGGRYSVAADTFWHADPVLRIESLLALMNKAGSDDRVPARMLDALRDQPSAGGVILQGAGWLLYQLGGQLIFGRDVAPHRESGYLFRVGEPAAKMSDINLPFVVDEEAVIDLPEHVVAGPLVVRSWRPGDSIRIRARSKSLKRLLPEIGVAKHYRSLVPVVEDADGLLVVVASVVGGSTAFADRAAEGAGKGSATVAIRFRTAIG